MIWDIYDAAVEPAIWISRAYLVVATIIGLLATYQNRILFDGVTIRYLRMAIHAITVGLAWPFMARMAFRPMFIQKTNSDHPEETKVVQKRVEWLVDMPDPRRRP